MVAAAAAAGATPSTSQPTTTTPAGVAAVADDPTTSLLAAAGYLAVAVLIAAGAGVFRRRSVHGPARLAYDTPVTPLVLVTFTAAGAWFLTQVAFGAAKAAQAARENPGKPFDLASLSAGDIAFLFFLSCEE